MATPPLTSAKHGSTRCPECRKRFEDTPRPTVDVVVQEPYTRKGSVAMGETRTVRYRWHTDCRAAAERYNEESRARAAADHEATMRQLCAAAGVDYDTLKEQL